MSPDGIMSEGKTSLGKTFEGSMLGSMSVGDMLGLLNSGLLLGIAGVLLWVGEGDVPPVPPQAVSASVSTIAHIAMAMMRFIILTSKCGCVVK
ncbi:hypothetical protein FACS1894217_09510 [Clostridia bacterium]|nr:hypothetical protein FACS1894217_09510 [Clostridia bacterium]